MSAGLKFGENRKPEFIALTSAGHGVGGASRGDL